MMKPYRPKVFGDMTNMPPGVAESIQARADDFYNRLGIETEIVEEDKGFILKAYAHGRHIGGLQQISDYITG